MLLCRLACGRPHRRCSQSSCDFFDLQRYLGQMPSSVLSQHYDMVDLERLGKIAGKWQEMGSIFQYCSLAFCR